MDLDRYYELRTILQQWIGPQGSVSPGEVIKVLKMDPRSGESPITETCHDFEIEAGVYEISTTPLRVHVRGQPCAGGPDHYCVCYPGDFVRLEPTE